MRNDFTGISIDGDRAACCPDAHNANATMTNHSCCDNRQPRNCTCRQARNTPCTCDNNRAARCGECEVSRQSRCGECGNDRAECTCGSTGNRRPPAMVYAQMHDGDNLYCAERALVRGTLFSCLDKPMCGDRCVENPCITRCQADQFAIWELRLYLNTHPCDQEALALLRKLTCEMDEDCGCVYQPSCPRWDWTDGPWPWEYQRCCGKEA